MKESVKKTGKAAKKSFLWLLRPGFSRNAASPNNEAVFQQRLVKRCRERLDLLYESERKLAEEKADIIEQLTDLSDEEAFAVWVNEFGHTEETLRIVERKLKGRRYFYFMFVLLAFYGVYLSFQSSGYGAVISGFSALLLAFLGLVSGLKESWRYHQVKQRSLFRFIEMWETPLKFIW